MKRCCVSMLASWLAIGAACGGSGGTDVASGGIGGTGISSGSVTGFGSYYVTGTEWSLGATGVVDYDGSTVGYDESDLRLGMYLRVDGERSADGATATSTLIRYDEAILGALEQTPFDVGPDRKAFTILGQQVEMDAGVTVFSDTSFDTLALDDVVEVSGPVDSGGGILATRIRLRGALALGATAVELKGSVANLGAGSFELGAASLSFDCGGATDCSALPGAMPTAGQRVEVEGVQTGDGAMPTIDALVIRPFTSFADAVGNAANLEIEGVIDDFAGLGSFTVHGVAVDASTARLDPDDPALFADGSYVEVEGDRTGGVLRARGVKLLRGRARVSARIASGGLDRLAQGEIVLLAEGVSGQPGFQQLVVGLDGSTRLVDESAVGNPDLRREDLLVGEFLAVRGAVIGAGRLRATDVRREDAGDVRLRGPVGSVDRDPGDGRVGYTALGIFVQLVQGTTTVPGGDVDAFLSGLAPGDRVDARDVADGSEETFDIADQVEPQ